MKKLLSLIISISLIITLVVGLPTAYLCIMDNNVQEVTAASYSTGYYKVNADGGLYLRAKAGTSYSKLKLIPNKTTLKITKISGSWGYTSYGGKSGWVSLSYTKYLGKYLTGYYKITASEGLSMRSGAGTSYSRVKIIPYKTTVKVTKIKGTWGYTSYGGKSGWIAMAYTTKTSGVVSVEKPTGVKAMTVSYTGIKLSWNKVSGVSGYYIYRATSSSGTYKYIKKLAGASKVSYTNTGLSKNRAYYYRIKAYKNSSSVCSDNSARVCGFTGSQGNSLSSVTCSSSSAALVKWYKPTYATGYKIYRATSKSGKYSNIKNISGLSTTAFKNTGLKVGKTYYYKIRTYRKIGTKTYYSGLSAAKGAKIVTIASSVAASGITKPTTLRVGQAFTIKGTVSSAYPIKKIRIGICNSAGSWISGKNVSKAPYTNTYNVYKVDSAIPFDKLAKGSYRYKIVVTDTKGYVKTAVNAAFTVKNVTTSFIWPCGSAANISQHFQTPDWTKGHAGLDIAMPYGTNIKASKAGTVNVAQTNQYTSSYGKYIIVEHGNGYATLYAHCSSLTASVGEKVSQGEVIAKVGSTGNSTGNHLHFEIRYNSVKKDPENYLP